MGKQIIIRYIYNIYLSKGLRLTTGRRPTWVCVGLGRMHVKLSGAYWALGGAKVGNWSASETGAPILSKIKLSGAHLGPRLGKIRPMWSMLGTSWAHVELMLAYVRPMLAYVGLGWAYIGLGWAYVGPILSHLGGYVGHMLAILGLCWGHVRQFKSSERPRPTKCRLCLSAGHALPTPPLKNTAFLHLSIFAASHFGVRNKTYKTQSFF